MASPSSRLKSGSSLSRDDVATVLRDGAAVRQPSEGLLRAVKHLKSLGLLTYSTRQFVRCADPLDSDFRFARNRYCTGRVYLEQALDEGGHDYRCPECERPVFPGRSSKRRHDELRITLKSEGVHAFVAKQLSGAGRWREVCTGVFEVEVNNCTVRLCVIDICDDKRYLARDQARVIPTLFLCVDEYSGEDRLLKEDWLDRAWLADVVCGNERLSERLGNAARHGAPSSTQNLSVAVYQSGPPPIRLGVSTDRCVDNAAKPSDEGDGPEGVLSPQLLRLNGRDHACDLTTQEIAFLKVALLQNLTPLHALMNGTNGAVWKEPYLESKRPAVRSMLKRVNAKLSSASPPVPMAFGLLRGQDFVERRMGASVLRMKPAE